MGGVRIIAVVLLLSNLMFFGWSLLPSAQPTGVTSEQSSDLQLKPAIALAPTRCLSLGPFSDAAALSAPVTALTARGVEARSRMSESITNNGWWVYVSGLKPASQLRAAMTKLRKAGIKDVAEIDFGAGDERLSVGIFSDHDRALSAAGVARTVRLSPTIEERQRATNEWWLDADIKREVSPPQAALLFSTTSTQLAPSWSECPPKAAGG